MHIKIKADSHDVAIHEDELWIRYEPSTADLIAELKTRVPCDLCEQAKTVCEDCFWFNVGSGNQFREVK